MFWYRRKEAIKLAWYVLFIEPYRDILSWRDRKFAHYCLKKADEEQQAKKLPGWGQTKGWKAYSQIHSDNKFLTIRKIIRLYKTL